MSPFLDGQVQEMPAQSSLFWAIIPHKAEEN